MARRRTAVAAEILGYSAGWLPSASRAIATISGGVS